MANDGSPPRIHELMQDGHDVVITLRILDMGEPGLDTAYTLTRDSAKELVSERVFQPAEAAQTERVCRHYSDQDLCAGADLDDPLCIDCDEDGLPECSRHEFENWCEIKYFFEVVDTCVRPGETRYTLSADDWGFSETQSLVVEEASGVCESGGCGCSAASDAMTAPVTGTMLLLVGLLGLRREGQDVA
jgi:MYXO-CTERM domain-containing protein